MTTADLANTAAPDSPCAEIVQPAGSRARYCGAPTGTTGQPCRQIVGLDVASGLCPHHDPARADEALVFRSRGGRAGGGRHPAPPAEPPADVPPAPESLADICRWHSWLAVKQARGEIAKAVASSIVYGLANFRAALVARDMEEQMKQLRAELKALKARQVA